jgi:hypothetical protein
MVRMKRRAVMDREVLRVNDPEKQLRAWRIALSKPLV